MEMKHEPRLTHSDAVHAATGLSSPRWRARGYAASIGAQCTVPELRSNLTEQA